MNKEQYSRDVYDKTTGVILNRQYKLWKLKVPIVQKYSILFKFMDSNILNLRKFRIKFIEDVWIIFLNEKNLDILQYDVCSKILTVNYKRFSKKMEKKTEFKFEEIKYFLEDLIEKHYNIFIHVIISDAKIDDDIKIDDKDKNIMEEIISEDEYTKTI